MTSATRQPHPAESCSPRAREDTIMTTPIGRSASPAPTSSGHEPHHRVGAAERERSTALLAEAFAAGYLTSDEFDQRVGIAISARTQGDLVALIADLPPDWVTRIRRARHVARNAHAARLGVRI